MKKKNILFATALLFMTASASFAWLNDDVVVRGELVSSDKKFIKLKTDAKETIQVPRKESDEIWSEKPILLKRTLAELREIRVIDAPARHHAIDPKIAQAFKNDLHAFAHATEVALAHMKSAK